MCGLIRYAIQRQNCSALVGSSQYLSAFATTSATRGCKSENGKQIGELLNVMQLRHVSHVRGQIDWTDDKTSQKEIEMCGMV